MELEERLSSNLTRETQQVLNSIEIRWIELDSQQNPITVSKLKNTSLKACKMLNQWLRSEYNKIKKLEDDEKFTIKI